MKFNLSDIARLRLNSHQLVNTTITNAADMVTWFGAVQGQEYAQTKWGLGLRLPKLSDADIEAELTESKILRTHLLRPTWHFVSSEDIRWLLKLTGPRVNAVNNFMYRQLELDEKIFRKSSKIIIKLLENGKHLTRKEIGEELKRNKIEAEGHRLSYIMMRSELDGIICSGIRRGKQFTYALLEERAHKSKDMDREEALIQLTKRYFPSRGPATINDYSSWSGLTMRECRKGIEAILSDLNKISVADNEYYFTKEMDLDVSPSSIIFLLPTYDEFIMGYKDRSAILQYRNGLKPDSSFFFDSMIVCNGQVIGTWKRTPGKKQIDLEYKLFNKVNSNKKIELNEALRRFDSFNKVPISITKARASQNL